jgi:hypothetical protein
MIAAVPVLLVLLILWVLTLLTWIEGLRAIRAATEPKSELQGRILPPMLLLTAPIVMLFGLLFLRFGYVVSPALPGRMVLIGAISALAALLTSFRAPRGFRGLAIAASMAWLVCFGLALVALFSLRGLR